MALTREKVGELASRGWYKAGRRCVHPAGNECLQRNHRGVAEIGAGRRLTRDREVTPASSRQWLRPEERLRPSQLRVNKMQALPCRRSPIQLCNSL